MLRAVRLRAEIPALAIGTAPRRSSARRAPALPHQRRAHQVRDGPDPRLPPPVRGPLLLDRLGLLAHRRCPKLDPLRGLVQNRYHHLDAFDHTLAAVEAADDLRGLARGLPPLVFADDPLNVAGPSRVARTEAAERTPSLPERARLLRWALLLTTPEGRTLRTLGEDGDTPFLHARERTSAGIAREGSSRRLRASRTGYRPSGQARPRSISGSRFPRRGRAAHGARGAMTSRALRRIARGAGPDAPARPPLPRRQARYPRAGRKERSRGCDAPDATSWKPGEPRRKRARREPRLLDRHEIMRATGAPPGPPIGRLLEDRAGSRPAASCARATKLSLAPPRAREITQES